MTRSQFVISLLVASTTLAVISQVVQWKKREYLKEHCTLVEAQPSDFGIDAGKGPDGAFRIKASAMPEIRLYRCPDGTSVRLVGAP